MKKLFALLLALMLMLSLAACGNATEPEEDDSTWKEFIAEYDAWVDDYIDLLEKYNEDPTDMTILSDYTEMMSDLTEWSDKADEVAEELEDSPEAAAEYASELAKIAAKLADAAY